MLPQNCIYLSIFERRPTKSSSDDAGQKTQIAQDKPVVSHSRPEPTLIGGSGVDGPVNEWCFPDNCFGHKSHDICRRFFNGLFSKGQVNF
jgi:hypothetical protein